MSFDHRDPGTDPDTWAVFLRGTPHSDLALGPGERVVVVSPHPDDETLGAGGLIASAAAQGSPVTVLVCTRGEGSHPDSPTMSPDRLAAVRDTEVVAALHTLHPEIGHVQLGIPDGRIDDHRDTLRAALLEALDASDAPVTVVAPWPQDGHIDHEAAGAVVANAVAGRPDTRLLQYPIWMWHWDSPEQPTGPWDEARTFPLDADTVDRKRRALDAYASQVRPLSDARGDEAIVDDRHARHHLRNDEWFFEPSRVPSRSRESFDEHYRRRPEGWDFVGSWYERRKRATTLAALPRERFRSALEIGCSTGVLTGELTERVDDVLGVDISDQPLEIARRNAPAARFARMTVPDEWPEGEFDLIVLSETGYYLSEPDLQRLIAAMAASLTDDGVLLACHWRHPDTEAVTDAEVVHTALRAAWPRPPMVRHVEPDFVLEVFAGTDVPSPAAAEGLTP